MSSISELRKTTLPGVTARSWQLRTPQSRRNAASLRPRQIGETLDEAAP
jgi:hypothetical protein